VKTALRDYHLLVFLMVGILLAFVAGLCVYFGQTCQVRAKAIEAVNERLRQEIAGREQAQKGLEQAQSHLQTFMENNPAVTFIKDEEGKYVYGNKALSELLDVNLEDFLGRNDFELYPKRVADQFRKHDDDVLSTNQPIRILESTNLDDEEEQWWSVIKFPIDRPDGKRWLAGVAVDITESKRIDDKLTEQRRILESILNSLADGVAVVNETGEFLLFNPAGQQIVGLGKTEGGPEVWPETYGLYLPDRQTHFPPEDLPLTRAMRGETVREAEVYVRPVDSPLAEGRWLSVNGTPLVDDEGNLHGGVAVFRDVTEHKLDQEKIKAEQDLLRRLLDIQERARKLIAYEIHDGAVQYVVASHMILESVISRLEKQGSPVAEEVEQAQVHLQMAIDECRRLIGELRPMVIDERGVIEAIKFLVTDERMYPGLKISFNHAVSFDRLDPHLEGVLFRIVQEALNNVKRHSGSETAEVNLSQINGSVRLEINDQGKGFDPSKVATDRFGVRGIRERSRLFGGKTKIESTPGEGTHILVEIPVQLPLGEGQANGAATG